MRARQEGGLGIFIGLIELDHSQAASMCSSVDERGGIKLSEHNLVCQAICDDIYIVYCTIMIYLSPM